MFVDIFVVARPPPSSHRACPKSKTVYRQAGEKMSHEILIGKRADGRF